jgi:hypothetical protein
MQPPIQPIRDGDRLVPQRGQMVPERSALTLRETTAALCGGLSVRDHTHGRDHLVTAGPGRSGTGSYPPACNG